jgi:DNA-binding transcriptional LysR family regulator
MRTTGRQIGGLEGRLGVTLFRREPRGVALTSAGTTAVEQARNVLGRLDAMEATMRTLASTVDPPSA